MGGAQFTCPLIVPIPGQLITAALWTNEFNNIAQNFNPLGMDGYQDTTAQAQIQTAPYPSSILSLATSLGGEIERLRYQLAALTGNTYWYQAPAVNIQTAANVLLPLGGVIDYHSSTPPNANFLLANGQAIGRSAYAALNTLYSAASYPFGSGDGSTTFNLPDYRDRISIGPNTVVPGPGYVAGATTHTLIDAELPATAVTVNITDPYHTHTATDSGHSHGVTDPGHSHTMTSGTNTANGTNVQDASNSGGGPLSTASHTTGLTVNSGTANVTNASAATGITASGTLGGGNGSHSILNPVIGMYKMIRVL
jgi:hypothetical protein